MLKITRLFIAGILATACTGALGQDRSDYFGQSPTQAEPAAVAAPAKRVIITNQPGDDRQQDADQRRDSVRERRADEPEPVETDFGEEDSERLPQKRKLDPIQAQPGQQMQQYEPVPRKRPTRPATPFQKFVFDSSGQKLPVFGADFFNKPASTFTPVGEAPVPTDHVLSAGDELLIRGWGSIDIDLRAKIDRNGLVSIPTVGSVVLAGVRAGDAEAVVRSAVARLYKGVTISVTFGKLRAITVYVVGQANRPGTYTVPGLSTLVTAVFASGGPNANGSLRRIQIKRGGKVAAELDLYAFIAKGDKSADVKLRDGDTIFIPSASGHAALVGKVNMPAIYELRGSGDTVASLLDVAGGMPVVADPRRAFLERIDASRNQPRSVEQFALDSEGLKRPLKNGDLLSITSITPEFGNAVVLRGNVDQPVRAPYRPGMRVSDLIPNRAYLMTRKSLNRQNRALSGDVRKLPVDDESQERKEREDKDTVAAKIGSMVDEVNWEYAVVERINRENLTVSLIPFNLGKVFTAPGSSDNVILMPGDTVTIFSQQDMAVPLDKRRVFVRVEGEVNAPGVYQMNAGENLLALLSRAGGPTGNAYLFGSAFYREQVRKEQELNLEKAANRLETQLRNEQSKVAANVRGSVDAVAAEARRQADLASAREAIARLRALKPTGRIAFGLDPREQAFNRLPALRLENGDRLVIPAKVEFVHVFGAVNAESSPLWRPNGRVNDYLKMVGLTPDADVDNVFILRVDGSVVSRESGRWFFGGFGGVIVMPGDSIVVPEKFDKETGWTKFVQGTKEWAQIFANFGLGAAAIQTLRN